MAVSARLVLFTSLLCAAAHAQTPPDAVEPAPSAPAAVPPPSPYAPYLYPPGSAPVPVDVVGTQSGLAFTISDKDGRPVAECPSDCRLLLFPGKYKVFVHATEDTLAGSRSVEIAGPTTLRVDPDSPSQRSVGLTMGIVGPILMAVGMAVVFANSCDHTCEPSEREQGNGSAAGGIALLGGLVMTPIGWVMFGSSFKPEVEVVGSGSAGAAARGPALRRSASFGAELTF